MREQSLYRWGVASRAVAAIAGGYLLAALLAAVTALALPASRAEATVTGTLLAFVAYPAAVMWVFAAINARRAWVGLAIPCAALAAALFVLTRSAA
jgi:uncharacterized membrane protein YjjP (DUF1212 family)